MMSRGLLVDPDQVLKHPVSAPLSSSSSLKDESSLAEETNVTSFYLGFAFGHNLKLLSVKQNEKSKTGNSNIWLLCICSDKT